MALGKSSTAFLGIPRGIKEKAFSAGPCSGQAALCLGQASCAGLGSRAGPAGHRHCVLGISQAREQGSCSFMDLHLLSLGWPQPGGCWGGPEPPLSQQLWCLARGCGCGGHAQSPAAACGGHCPGLLGRAGLGRGQGAGERAGSWGEVGRSWAGLGSAWQRATAASGSGGSMHGRAPSRAWCCRARAARKEPRAAGAGERRLLWALTGLGKAGRGPRAFVPHRRLPGPARWSWSIQGQALHCDDEPCLPSSCHALCADCSRGDPQPAPAWGSATHLAPALSSALLAAL